MLTLLPPHAMLCTVGSQHAHRERHPRVGLRLALPVAKVSDGVCFASAAGQEDCRAAAEDRGDLPQAQLLPGILAVAR
jgi:hypothetical protein